MIDLYSSDYYFYHFHNTNEFIKIAKFFCKIKPTIDVLENLSDLYFDSFSFTTISNKFEKLISSYCPQNFVIFNKAKIMDSKIVCIYDKKQKIAKQMQ